MRLIAPLFPANPFYIVDRLLQLAGLLVCISMQIKKQLNVEIM